MKLHARQHCSDLVLLGLLPRLLLGLVSVDLQWLATGLLQGFTSRTGLVRMDMASFQPKSTMATIAHNGGSLLLAALLASWVLIACRSGISVYALLPLARSGLCLEQWMR